MMTMAHSWEMSSRTRRELKLKGVYGVAPEERDVLGTKTLSKKEHRESKARNYSPQPTYAPQIVPRREWGTILARCNRLFEDA